MTNKIIPLSEMAKSMIKIIDDKAKALPKKDQKKFKKALFESLSKAFFNMKYK